MSVELKKYFEEYEDEFFLLFRQLIETNSYSYNKTGIDKISDIIKSYLGENFIFKTINSKEFGNLLIASTPAVESREKQIMLCGHMDTVFSQDFGFLDYDEVDGIIKGPGVYDMKGGLLIGIMALKFLEHKKLLNQIPITFFFNSDEEISSPFSTKYIEEEAKKSACVIVLEGGGKNGEIVTGRKGKIGATLECFGEAGHSAFKIADKRSAILELANKIIEIEKLNNADREISANVGKITGGVGPNTISEYAKASIDIRYTSSEDKEELKKALNNIESSNFIKGVTSKIKIVSSRGSMDESAMNISLYEEIKNIADKYGIRFGKEFRGGVSDANTISALKIPVLDGFGPIGADDHSKNEFIVKNSVEDRFIILTEAIHICFKQLL